MDNRGIFLTEYPSDGKSAYVEPSLEAQISACRPLGQMVSRPVQRKKQVGDVGIRRGAMTCPCVDQVSCLSCTKDPSMCAGGDADDGVTRLDQDRQSVQRRRAEVLRLSAEGMCSQDIAAKLGLSYSTVREARAGHGFKSDKNKGKRTGKRVYISSAVPVSL